MGGFSLTMAILAICLVRVIHVFADCDYLDVIGTIRCDSTFDTLGHDTLGQHYT